MYKLLLCQRYLRTRYIALASIISVTLGVATMIVVNSVMAGFSTKLKDRFHGLLADVIIESPSYNGFPLDTDEMMARINASPAAAHIEAFSPTDLVATALGFGPSASKTHSSALVRLLRFRVFITILPPVGPEALVSRSNSSAVRTLGWVP